MKCPTPGCTGLAEYQSLHNVYLCLDCMHRFEPKQMAPAEMAQAGTVFCGRHWELARLESIAEKVRSASPHVVLIHGEPGIGKTALMRAFYHKLSGRENDPDDFWPDVVGELSNLSEPDDQLAKGRLGKRIPFLWLAGQAPAPHDGSCLPMHVWLRAFEGLRNLPLGMQPRERAQHVAMAIGKGIADLGADLIGIGLMKTIVETSLEVGKVFADKQQGRMGVEQVQPDMARALEKDVVRIVGMLSRRNEIPFVIISLDDLQWADESTVSGILACCRAASRGNWKLLLLLGYRENEIAAGRCPLSRVMPSLHRYSEQNTYEIVDLPLGELDVASSTSLVERYFPAAGKELLDWLSRDIGGAPFYLHQFCELLIQRGDVTPPGTIRNADGVNGLKTQVACGGLPVKIEFILRERLDRLDEQTRRLLAYASVEGRFFTDSYLERVTARLESNSLKKDAIHLYLNDCERLHKLIRSEGKDSLLGWPYEFIHDFLQVAAGRQLSGPIRRSCEEVLTEWLLEKWKAQEFAEMSLIYRRRVLGKLVALIPFGADVDGRFAPETIAQLYCDMLSLSRECGMISHVLQYVEPWCDYISKNESRLDRQTQSDYYLLAGDLMNQLKRKEEAERYLHKAIDIGTGLATETGSPEAQQRLCWKLDALGDLLSRIVGRQNEAKAVYQRALFLRRQLLAVPGYEEERYGIFRSLFNSAVNTHTIGDLNQAEQYYREAIAEGEKQLEMDHGPALTEDLCFLHLNYSELTRGNDDELTYHHLLRSLELGNQLEQGGLSTYLAMIHEDIGTFHQEHGDNEEAETSLAKALRISRQIALLYPEDNESQFALAHTLVLLGEIRQAQGLLQSAKECYLEALELYERFVLDRNDFRQGHDMSRVYKLLGSLMLEGQDYPGAEMYFNQMMEITGKWEKVVDGKEANTVLAIADSYAQLAKLCWAQEKFGDAKQNLEKATILCKSIASTSLNVMTQRSYIGSLAEMAHICRYTGELERAADCQLLAIRLLEEPSGDTNNGKNAENAERMLTNMYTTLADIQIQKKDYRFAGKNYLIALEKCERMQPSFETLRSTSPVLEGLVLVSTRNGRIGEAEQYAQRLIDVNERIVAQKPDDITALFWLGRAYENLGDVMNNTLTPGRAYAMFDKAREMLERCNKQIDADDFREGLAHVYLNLASLVARFRQTGECKAWIGKSRLLLSQLSPAVGDRYSEWIKTMLERVAELERS